MSISHDFFEKLVILALTAVLTGFLVPYVLRRVDEAKNKDQKLFESDLARQTKLIDAQAKFLDDITEILWRWRYLSIRVTVDAQASEERYTAVVKDYEDKIWDVLSSLRNQISRSRRLVSDDAFKSLVSLYDRMTEIESKLSQGVVRTGLPKQNRIPAAAELNDTFRWEMTSMIDEIIDMLAREVGLKELRTSTSGFQTVRGDHNSKR